MTPFVLAATVGVNPSWGSATSAPAAAGTITCTGSVGSFTFNPALTLAPSVNKEVAKVKITLTHCTTSEGTAPTKGVLTTTITITTTNNTANDCTNLDVSTATKSTVSWTVTPAIAKSVVRFSGFTPATSKSGKVGFTEPNTGGTASVTGSFPGSDGGATSTGASYSNKTAAQIFSACESSTGLKSLPLKSGSLNLQ